MCMILYIHNKHTEYMGFSPLFTLPCSAENPLLSVSKGVAVKRAQ